MPVNKRRRKPARREHRPPPQQQPRAPAARKHDRVWKRRIGWVMVAVGAPMFLIGNIGARTGVVALPFDPHHVIAQLGGGLIAVVGLMVATGST
jgi:hypothetical protein